MTTIRTTTSIDAAAVEMDAIAIVVAVAANTATSSTT